MELKIRQKYIAKILPFSLLAILFATALVTVFVQADSYGITVDEPTQNSYGQSVLAWYQTHGRNQSFLHYPKTLYMPEHGAAFEVIVALAQQTFGYPWHGGGRFWRHWGCGSIPVSLGLFLITQRIFLSPLQLLLSCGRYFCLFDDGN